MFEARPSKAGPFEVLNVAIATDTILYTPFSAAYYSGDFDDTPFGGVSINLVASVDDKRFKIRERINGDGFATFCLLLGLADAAIGDPSYIVYLWKSNRIVSEFALFQESLTPNTKGHLVERHPNCLSLDETGNLIITDLDVFKALSEGKKVLGGIVSKMVLSGIGGSALLTASKLEQWQANEKMGRFDRKDALPFLTQNATAGRLVYYKYPSTGYCVGEKYASLYAKKGDSDHGKKLVSQVPFGDEISEFLGDAGADSVALSCDYVAIDFLLTSPNSIDGKGEIVELVNLAEDGEPQTKWLFTGILGNTKVQNQDILKAFLYGIDKNLNIIEKYLNEYDTIGLTRYLKKKYNYDEFRLPDLLELIVANKKCRDEIHRRIKDEKDHMEYTFDSVLRSFVDRLYRCRAHGGFYFKETTPDPIALKRIVEFRCDATDLDVPNRPSASEVEAFVGNDLLEGWRKEQNSIHEYEANKPDLVPNLGNAALFFAPFLWMFKKGKMRLRQALWNYISTPVRLYTAGSLFLLFELISGLCHAMGTHLTLGSLATWGLGLLGAAEHPCGVQLIRALDLCDLVLFWYLVAWCIVVIMLSRVLIRLHDKKKYVYRYG